MTDYSSTGGIASTEVRLSKGVFWSLCATAALGAFFPCGLLLLGASHLQQATGASHFLWRVLGLSALALLQFPLVAAICQARSEPVVRAWKYALLSIAGVVSALLALSLAGLS